MRVIYADASALAKLVLIEDESAALRRWLAVALPAARCVTNVVGEVEVVRAAARHGPTRAAAAQAVLEGWDVVDVSPRVRQLAAALEPATVRTLDALHLATAAYLESLDAFLTYDQRMIDAARALRLPVTSPGREPS